MRWLLFLVAVSASADCTSAVLYRTPDYMTKAVIDDKALYVSLLLGQTIDRIDLATGTQRVVDTGNAAVAGAWGVENGLLVTADTIGRPAGAMTVRDGFVYWIEPEHALRRMIAGGRDVEVVAESVDRYVIFEDRVVFLSGGKLFWKPLTAVTPVLLASDVEWVGSVTNDGILVSNSAAPTMLEGSAEVRRVSWGGEVSEPIYSTRYTPYHGTINVTAVDAGAITYIVRTISYATTLFVLRDGVLTERYNTTGPIWILDTNQDALTIAQWGLGTGFHEAVRLCASATRSRAVR